MADDIGWFQGRMEFGPRALGNRSIMVDPRSSAMQSALNPKINIATRFVLSRRRFPREDVADWFRTRS